MNIGNVFRQPVVPTSGGPDSSPVDHGHSLRSPAIGSAQPPQSPVASNATTVATTRTKTTDDKAKQLAQDAQHSREAVEQLVSRISKQIRIDGRSLSFKVDHDLGKTVVKVIDKETDEVIRQIPSEELIKIAQTISALTEQNGISRGITDGTGLLIQEKV